MQQINSEDLGYGTGDRVRQQTHCELNERVDRETQECLSRFASASRDEITAHINELDREWDVERRLQANASLLAFSGVVLGATVSKKWLAVPGVVLSFLVQHALQGWCPPMPIFRKMGARTAKEIGRERYALKALRGDFSNLKKPGPSDQDQT
jgi:hypothetical protein